MSPPAESAAGPSTWLETQAVAASDAGDEAGVERRERSRRPRLLRAYAGARAALGVALVVAMAFVALLGVRGGQVAQWVILLYAVQAVTLWLLPRFEALLDASPRGSVRHRQWFWTIGVDLLAFFALHSLEAGSTFTYAALLVLPVLMAGVLMPRMAALATTSAVALGLLGVAVWVYARTVDGSAALVQAGLAGIGLFLIVLLAAELAARLAREEASARSSLALARQQAQLNRLVIDEMVEGVLVVGSDLRVRAANPAARALLAPLGLAPPAPFSLEDQPAWANLAASVREAYAQGRWDEATADPVLRFAEQHQRTLRVRARFTRGPVGVGGEGSVCVLALEDLRQVQARVRQEKLAAMGRVSAGIAHEIRNPLAAIAQANALLQEDGVSTPHQRLTQIVQDNVERLKRIVDEVLEAVPSEVAGRDAQRCDARAIVAQVLAERAAVVRVRADVQPLALWVKFDGEHLRRVVVNLLDNALRHGTDLPEAVLLRLAPRDEHSAVLSVASDGPPIAPSVEPHLFEPFFSTRSRGSGLGLYICRELCERHCASIEFRMREPPDRYRNSFIVVMRRSAADALSRHG
jgi:two-component system sensor histidine kinase PilS (NtrC family)